MVLSGKNETRFSHKVSERGLMVAIVFREYYLLPSNRRIFACFPSNGSCNHKKTYLAGIWGGGYHFETMINKVYLFPFGFYNEIHLIIRLKPDSAYMLDM